MDKLLNPETDERLLMTAVRLYDSCVMRAWFNRGLSFGYRIAKISRGKRRSRVGLLVSPKSSRGACSSPLTPSVNPSRAVCTKKSLRGLLSSFRIHHMDQWINVDQSY